MRSRHQRRANSDARLLFGVGLAVVGSLFLISVLDLSAIIPADLTYRGPIGEFTYSGEPEKELRIFIGVIFLGSGAAVIMKSNRSN